MASSFFVRGALAALLAAGAQAQAADAGNTSAAAPAQAASANTAADTARPAVGGPVVQAQELVRAGKFTEALAKLDEAEKAVTDPTPYERYVLSRTKAAAALGAGQSSVAFDAIEAALATDKVAGEARLSLIESLVQNAYAAKDYARVARWASRYAQEGGTKDDVETLRVQALYLAGDNAGAAAALLAKVKADDAANRVTPERTLQLLASAQRKLNDSAGSTATMERLATRYPKPAYWGDLLSNVDRKALPDRLLLDLFRLVRATGNLASADQHLLLAGLAMEAGFPAETLAVLDEAAAKGVFAGGEPAQAKALRAKARKQAGEDAAARQRDEAAAHRAHDGNALVTLGQLAIAEGQVDHGIAMIEEGLAKGGVRHADEVRLRLGAAQAQAGRAGAAAKTLAPLQGTGGMATLAHLWTLYAASARPGTPVASTQGDAAR
ncbi:MAG TPA: hypothetical protein VJ743_12835 [Albitalea sp.]|nr:hypothetical protein [Albitalea sp.]